MGTHPIFESDFDCLTEMSLQSRHKMLNLYKRVLKSHKALPIDLKHFGDVYVKVEFRQHRDAKAEFIPEFVKQWELYAADLESQTKASEDSKKIKFGKPISVDLLEKDLSADQQMQLYELMKETTKPAPQYSNIKESTTFVDKPTDK